MTALLRLKIDHDDDAQDPRTECENAGTMACWHRRYKLGDVQPEGSPEDYRERLVLDLGLNAFDNPPCTCHADDSRQVDQVDPTEDTCYRCGGSFSERDKAAGLFAEHFIELPLYLYDHSGITMSTGAFGCKWDSGQVGFIYISRVKAAEEWSTDTEERAIACMKSEVEHYDEYLTGNVHGYTVERGTRTNITFEDGRDPETSIEWEHEDSCWGFYGDWWKAGDPTGMGDSFDGELKELFDSMDYNDVGEWRYVASVPEEDRDEE
jgi:hypothetical protein